MDIRTSKKIWVKDLKVKLLTELILTGIMNQVIVDGQLIRNRPIIDGVELKKISSYPFLNGGVFYL
jgi:hypothetical protein